jgi:hypothetical protein
VPFGSLILREFETSKITTNNKKMERIGVERVYEPWPEQPCQSLKSLLWETSEGELRKRENPLSILIASDMTSSIRYKHVGNYRAAYQAARITVHEDCSVQMPLVADA